MGIRIGFPIVPFVRLLTFRQVRQMKVVERSFPFGAVASILLFIVTVVLDVWSKIPWYVQILLALALVILFFCNWSETKVANDG